MPRGDSIDTDPLPGSRGATLTQLYESIVYTTSMGLRVAMPAEVVEYTAPVPNVAPALVKVRLHFKSAREIDNPAEKLRFGEIPFDQGNMLLAIGPIADVPNCPVLYHGHAGMRSQGPLDVGEVGLYVVCDRSLDAWINEGGPVDPSFSQMHDISDGVFIPGLRSGNIAQVIPVDVDTIGREDGTAVMSINRATKDIAVTTDGPNATIDAASTISLGSTATLGVARLTDKTSADTSMLVWMATVNAALAAGVPTVVAPPTDFGVITSASSKVSSE